MEVSRSVFTKNREVGVSATGSNTHLKLQDVLVYDTQSQKSNGMWGMGLEILEGASVEVSRSVFNNNRCVGVGVSGTNTKLKLHDVLVNNTQSQKSDGTGGRGLQVQDGASAKVSRSVFTNNREFGVRAYGSNTQLKLDDVLVNNTQSQESDEKFGRGLGILEGASVEAHRSVFTKNRDVGVIVSGRNTHLTLHDVLVYNTQSRQSDSKAGRGLSIIDGASVELLRSAFANNRDVAVFVSGSDTYLKLDDVLVNNTLSQPRDGMFGRGLIISDGSSVEVSRSVFTNNRELGVFAVGSETHVQLNDVIIANTLGREGVYSKEFGGGTGIGSYGEASIEMNRFVLSQNAHCGAQLAFGIDNSGNIFEVGGEIKLSNGIISYNKLCGINVQTENIDLEDLSETVVYFDNNYNNLDTDALLTPEVSVATP